MKLRLSVTLTLGLLTQCGSESADGEPGGQTTSERSPETAQERLEFREGLEQTRTHLLHGDLAAAGSELEQLARLSPADPEVDYQRAKLALATGSNPEPAIELLESAWDKRPGDVKIGRLLNHAYQRARRGEDAAWTLLEIVRHHPEQFAFFLSAAREIGISIYREPGQDSTRSLLEERARLLETLLDYDPYSDQALELLAWTWLAMGEYREAARLYSQWIERFGQSGASAKRARLIYFDLGSTLYRDGRPQEAARAYRNAIDASGQRVNPNYLWNLSLCFPEGMPPNVPPRYRAILAPRPSRWLESISLADVSRSCGVNKLDGAGPSAWGDLDGDGDLDLFVSGCNTYPALYLSNGDGTFRNATRESGLDQVRSGFSSLFADYDNDGDLDLFVGRDGWFGPGPNSLYRNDGSGRFEDVTAEANVDDPGSGFAASYWDYDNDGWLDLIIANGVSGDGSSNRLLRNRGDGTFEDVTMEAGLYEEGRRTIGLACLDYDKDGNVDLFLNGFLGPNRLYRNRGDGTFEDATAKAGVSGSRFEIGYVALSFDYDNDTWPDLFSSQYEHAYNVVMEEFLQLQPAFLRKPDGQPRRRCRVFRNLGDGTFEERTEQAGFLAHGAMGGNYGDVNRDGFVDVYLGTGGPAMNRFEPNALYMNEEGQRFVEIGWQVGVGDIGKGHGISLCDFDRDGDLDIYSPQGGAYHGDYWENRLFRNDCPNSHHWVTIRLIGTASNRDGVGARVTLECGSQRFYRELQCGTGFGSTNSLEMEFGLGEIPAVDRLRIDWPSGTHQILESVPVDRFLTVTEGSDEIEETPPERS